ncbi:MULTISPECIES: hypothetical protein [Nostocales]|uniref:Uncharacterized protein n=3 Tax=Nostocales TaxID=1161 RepID=A0A8S9T5W9_9CYAN|nr:hypothetical protein [Tolypothrix bouteillei]KAF3887795.1 hypothetical protein DA73_0400021575 [Tolypothrix bouteillei VB521301]
MQTTKAYGYTYEAKEYKTVEAWGWLKNKKKYMKRYSALLDSGQKT